MKKIMMVVAMMIISVIFVAKGNSVYAETFYNPCIDCNIVEDYAPTFYENVWRDNINVLHAGGTTQTGVRWSDSSEAIENTMTHGNNWVIELDFNYTSDGSVAVIHDWNETHQFVEGYPSGYQMSYQEFKYGKIFGQTTIFLEDVCNYMLKYPKMMVITDIKTSNVYGAKRIHDYLVSIGHSEMINRFIVQCYNYDQIDEVQKFGFKTILTVYKMGWVGETDIEALSEIVNSGKILALTFPVELIDYQNQNWKHTYLDELIYRCSDKLSSRECKLITHTIDSDQMDLIEKLNIDCRKNCGFSVGVCTDNVYLKNNVDPSMILLYNLDQIYDVQPFNN